MTLTNKPYYFRCFQFNFFRNFLTWLIKFICKNKTIRKIQIKIAELLAQISNPYSVCQALANGKAVILETDTTIGIISLNPKLIYQMKQRSEKKTHQICFWYWTNSRTCTSWIKTPA
ncbi:conserved haemoplasma hypothetical protein [Candidatus Mycoplasma haemominutum 'Birmingham 1']|uniref:Uncharacterized protein n=1 Tax=Candidatus Mycoplasma haematominutum 'Birmingham 1' TaxID=1116213 RepID=G8C2H5_9MOLU|nr:conserved haemoplasma hypothetical protein [Candidatus Mycoplasma haematominutum 'Birmingham 1']